MNAVEAAFSWCIDASVLIQAWTGAETSCPSLELLRRCDANDGILRGPTLLMAEIASVLHRKSRDGEIPPGSAPRFLEQAYHLPLVLDWKLELMLSAQALAAKMGERTTYDASYLAVAMHYRIPLITRDLKLLKRARKLYHHVYRPEEMLN